MKKEIVKKLLKNQQITQAELTEFVYDYVKEEKNIEPTAQQLTGIINAINMGIFSLNDAVKKSAVKLGLQVNTLVGKAGNILRIDVYENN